MTLLRYPGGKTKVARRLLDLFPPTFPVAKWEFRAPFVGAGAVEFEVLELLDHDCPIWLNDIDANIAALWRSMLDSSHELSQRVARFVPSPEAFHEFKDQCDDPGLSDAERGFRTLALHRMTFSGLGVMASSAMGSTKQRGDYNAASRWNAARLCREIARLHGLLARFATIQITCLDFAEVLADAPAESLAYIDPPFYRQGPALYRHAMSDADHERLAAILRRARCHWVLSYDDHPRVHKLYRGWAEVHEMNRIYSTAPARGRQRPTRSELAIAPRG